MLLLVSSVAVEGKEDVEIIGRDMDSTGLVISLNIGHDFYIGGADASAIRIIYVGSISCHQVMGKRMLSFKKVTRKISLSHK